MPDFKERLYYIDVVRGFAIFIMLFANSAPYLLEEPYPFWFRVMSSLAAPLFVSLSGFMLGKKTLRIDVRKNRLRGGLILFTAACIDILIWKTLPFATFDVLYVIGFSVLLFPLFAKLARWQLVSLCVFFFIVAFALQLALDYSSRELIYPFAWENMSVIFRSSRTLFLDGWFPIFPWMGFFIVGMYAGKYGFSVKSHTKKWILTVAVLTFLLSSIALYMQHRPLREAFGELFYPADIMFCIMAMAFLVILEISAGYFNFAVLKPLAWLGRSSLFFYILHLVLIVFFIKNILNLFHGNFIATYIIFILIIGVIAWLMHRLKQTRLWQKLPYVLRFWLGS